MTRSEQLKDWERRRSAELSMDVVAHWLRSLPAVVVAVAAWKGVSYFDLSSPDTWRFAIALLAIVQIAGGLIVWLRLWGAYIERRLTEVEALLSNEMPEYYASGDLIDFERNPLYARLAALESAVKRAPGGTNIY